MNSSAVFEIEPAFDLTTEFDRGERYRRRAFAMREQCRELRYSIKWLEFVNEDQEAIIQRLRNQVEFKNAEIEKLERDFDLAFSAITNPNLRDSVEAETGPFDSDTMPTLRP